MVDKSLISWTRRTWNPLYGCSRVSEGCRNCYAEQVVASLARKMRGSAAGEFYGSLVRETSAGPRWTGEVKIHEGRLLDPLKWREPGLVFVNSLSDVFHDAVSLRDIARIWAVMGAAPRQTFQVLTKRPARMLGVLSSVEFAEALDAEAASLFAKGHGQAGVGEYPTPNVLPNVWLGVSVESQEAANERIPLLLRTPAALRWLSCEPLLGEVDLCRVRVGTNNINALRGRYFPRAGAGPLPCESIDWVVCGGESGPGRRDMSPSWSDSLQAQCAAAGVPFFFKQHTSSHAGTVYPEILPGGVLVRQFPEGYNPGEEEVSRG